MEYPKGDPREPMTEKDLDDKFEGLASDLLSKERQKEIKEVIFNAEKYSAKDFMEKLIV